MLFMADNALNNLGIICRSDRTGLGTQSLNYVKLLCPSKIMLINSKPFNGNEQHPEWYEGFNVQHVMGFPAIRDINFFLRGITSVLSGECFYSNYFPTHARAKGVKTFLAPNIEFSDVFAAALGIPSRPETKADFYLLPSHWMEEQWMQHLPNSTYLPVPVFPADFKKARDINFARQGRRRFVHVIGKPASSDRSGYESILEALPLATSDFELVIRSQYELEVKSDDRRLTYAIGDIADNNDLYEDFDAMIQPRRYGGNNLPGSEALMAGLPVIMTNISPNSAVLPVEWLVPSTVVGQLRTRILLDVYGADPNALAQKIDWLATIPYKGLQAMKSNAFEIGYNEYSDTVLRPKYEELLK